MPQDGLGDLIALSLAAMAVIAFWRQLLILVLSLVIAVFCLGLIYLAEILLRR